MYNLNIAISALADVDTYSLVVTIASLCMLPAFIWMSIASIRVNNTYKTYNRVRSKSNMTGAEVARKILNEAGLYNVRIEPCRGNLTDHYDPRRDIVFLSESTFGSTSVAAHGVAAHEVGHAIQYATHYVPVKVRTALVPVLNFSSKFAFPLLMLSVILEIFMGYNMISNTFLAVAVAIYGIYALFTLVTLPVEYNASRRAKKTLLKLNILEPDELEGTERVLSAAVQTYLVSFIVSFLQFIRLLFILLSRRDRD